MRLLEQLEYATNVVKQLLKLSIFTLLLFCGGYFTYKWVKPKDQLPQVEKKVILQDEAVGLYSKQDDVVYEYITMVAEAEVISKNSCKKFIRACRTGWCGSNANRIGKMWCAAAQELKQIKRQERHGSERWVERTASALVPLFAEVCRHQQRRNDPRAANVCAGYQFLKNYASTMGVEI